jgi:hypothetical protein
LARRWPDPAEAARVVATLLNETVRHLLKPSNPHVRNDLRISSTGLPFD